MRQLMRMARAMGLEVEWARLGDEVRGFYEHYVQTITLNTDLPLALLRSAFAHELGHAHYGHEHADDPLIRERQELLADRWAADLLITDTDYARAEVVAGSHVGALALELGCDTVLVETYQCTRLKPVPRPRRNLREPQ